MDRLITRERRHGGVIKIDKEQRAGKRIGAGKQWSPRAPAASICHARCQLSGGLSTVTWQTPPTAGIRCAIRTHVGH
ncbi:unnamed protein product, partial [Iphiclides podalirius]